jgi:hypothetical protein
MPSHIAAAKQKASVRIIPGRLAVAFCSTARSPARLEGA